SPEDTEHIRQGRAIPAENAPLEELARAVTPDGQTLAILRGAGDKWQPYKVFHT
ncbi:MAG: tRNA pseudouridine(55) synthase TruB, partial [Anaerolineae bacterium]|nr:tRNA pseudouridine(55) synthase TruB [Anaerolineae bacterium]